MKISAPLFRLMRVTSVAIFCFFITTTMVLADQPLLAGNKTVGVSVYNMHYNCPDDKLISLIQQSIQQGNSWEIIGFSETRQSEKECFATQLFVEKAKSAGLTYYCRRQNSPNLDDLNVAICSKYPLNESSYMEVAIHPYGPRVMQCIEVLIPNNPLIVCNTHVKTGGDASTTARQLRTGISFVVNTAANHFIPASVTNPAERLIYKNANLARTIVMGDFNSSSKGVYPFEGTCNEPKEKDCFFGSWDVDHITLANMTHPIINAQPPLNQEFLQAHSFRRDTTLPWDTDHIGPVLAQLGIKTLRIPVATLTPEPTQTPLPSTSPIPTSSLHTYKGKPAIKMLTFNVGGMQGGRDLAVQMRRWRQLATFAKDKKIKVVLLQELSRGDSPDGDYARIVNAFTEVGYPVYEVHYGLSNGEANVILSTYPFVPNSYSSWGLSTDTRRYPISVAIQTPYGPIKVVNIHTHFKYSCDQAARLFEAYTNPASPQFSPPGEAIVIGGDYNVFFDRFDPVSSRNCQGSPQEEQRLQAVLPSARLSCEDTQTCSNMANRYVDLFFSLKTSSTLIYQTWVDSTISHLGNGHPPVIALIGNSSWTSHTVPSPSPGSNPGSGDFNGDGVVNGADFTLFVATAFTDASCRFNIVGRCSQSESNTIDIFDFNELMDTID